MTARSLKAVHPAHRDDIRDLQTRRPLPGPAVPQIDPFLFLNHHGPQTYPPGNQGLPFGPHPHRGFETLTFILEGELAHRDSAGHESIIGPGGIQWMTAGSGLIHSELSPDRFKRSGGPLEILQLWINLPGRLKMVQPAYTGVQQPDIPVLSLAGGQARMNLIAGSFDGTAGPIQSLTGIMMSTVTLEPGAEAALAAPQDRNVFFYVVRGEVALAGRKVPQFNLVEMSRDGDEIRIESASGAVLLFGHGQPINEPVVAHGPFVMNSREEIIAAIRDYEAGKFHGVQLA